MNRSMPLRIDRAQASLLALSQTNLAADLAMPQSDESTKVLKRFRGVCAVQRTPAYILVKMHRPRRPPTPDPHAKLSKRQWEATMMRYRRDLREELHNLSRDWQQ